MENKKRLIDANEAKKKLRAVQSWFVGYPSTEQDKLAQAVVQMCIDEIDKIKTVDAVEVVRCKECDIAQKDELFGSLWCNGTIVKGDYFCGSGKRKDREQFGNSGLLADE